MLTKNKKKLTLRVDQSLIEAVKVYANQRNTSVSRLVEVYFLGLATQTESEKPHTQFVQDLTGIIPSEIDIGEIYNEHLMEKYNA